MKLIKSIHVCKSCFRKIKHNNIHSLFNLNSMICSDCINELDPVFEKFKILKYDALSIFKYTEIVKEKINQYKKNEDVELADLFISPFRIELKMMFDDFVIVPIPSYEEDDLRRGYNHTKTIFSKIGLKIIDCLKKTKDVKQKELNYSQRQEIGKYLVLKEEVNLKNKKVLIVDDLITTGASMKAAIKLIEILKPRKIKVLSIAHTELKSENINENG